MIKEDLKKFGTKKSASAGNRYIIILRAGKDPLTFKSNAEFQRYLGITGNARKAGVTEEYGPQTVAGQAIIHVPKSMYDSQNLARFKWKGTSTRTGNRINREASRRSKESAEQ